MMKDLEGTSSQSAHNSEILDFKLSIEREKDALRVEIDTLLKKAPELLETYLNIQKQLTEVRNEIKQTEQELADMLFNTEINHSAARNSEEVYNIIKTSDNVVDFTEHEQWKSGRQNIMESLNDTLTLLINKENKLAQSLLAVIKQRNDLRRKVMSLNAELHKLETTQHINTPHGESNESAEIVKFRGKDQKT